MISGALVHHMSRRDERTSEESECQRRIRRGFLSVYSLVSAAMLSLQLPVSFLPPGRFFPPQHMVGLTVLTYLLSCSAYPTHVNPLLLTRSPLLLTRSLSPLSHFLFLLLDPGEASAGAGGAPQRATRRAPPPG